MGSCEIGIMSSRARLERALNGFKDSSYRVGQVHLGTSCALGLERRHSV